jgi:hypothetical protein
VKEEVLVLGALGVGAWYLYQKGAAERRDVGSGGMALAPVMPKMYWKAKEKEQEAAIGSQPSITYNIDVAPKAPLLPAPTKKSKQVSEEKVVRSAPARPSQQKKSRLKAEEMLQAMHGNFGIAAPMAIAGYVVKKNIKAKEQKVPVPKTAAAGIEKPTITTTTQTKKETQVATEIAGKVITTIQPFNPIGAMLNLASTLMKVM